MKPKHHFYIALYCFILVVFEVIAFSSIITHPYMLMLMLILCGVGAVNFGLGLGKLE